MTHAAAIAAAVTAANVERVCLKIAVLQQRRALLKVAVPRQRRGDDRGCCLKQLAAVITITAGDASHSVDHCDAR